MYISTSTYGGIDWHDSYTVYRQLKDKDSYCIEEQMVPDMIAGDIACTYPYVENLKEKVLHALSEESCFRFMIKTESTDADGNIVYQDCETCDENGQIWYENEATFNGKEQTLMLDYAYGQVSYITTYHAEDIPNEHLGYIVTEDFLAPSKGVSVVERLYHDIFDDLQEAQSYADTFRLHDFGYPKSVMTFLVCNKNEVSQTTWYQQQKKPWS